MNVDPIFDALDASASALDAQSLRLRLATENLANVDTPGYRRKLISFMAAANGVEPGRVSLDPTAGKTIYDPNHPLAGADGSVTMSNVNMMIEMADAREAGRSYDANLQAFSQARQLYTNLWEILQR